MAIHTVAMYLYNNCSETCINTNQSKALKSHDVIYCSVFVFTATPITTGVNGQFRDSPHNATSLLSQRTILTCSLPDNPPPNIRWTVNGAEITTSDRINITYNPVTGESQLIIDELLYTDNGAYQCMALVGNVLMFSDTGYVTAVG